MPLSPLIPDPALAEQEIDAAYARKVREQFPRDPEFAERWLARYAATIAEYRATAAEREARWESMPRVPRDPLDGDYEMIGTRRAYEFGE